VKTLVGAPEPPERAAETLWRIDTTGSMPLASWGLLNTTGANPAISATYAIPATMSPIVVTFNA
jgi:hypothetical protein